MEVQFRAAITEFLPSLKRISESYASNSEEAEEILQEILIAAWQSLPKFRKEASLKTFFFRIAQNIAIKQWLKRKRHHQNRESEPVSDVFDRRENQEAKMINQQNISHLIASIRQLKPLQLEVLTLYLEDCSIREISATIGISENAVTIRLHRAKNELINIMGKDK